MDTNKFGKEWELEMMKKEKHEIVDLLRSALNSIFYRPVPAYAEVIEAACKETAKNVSEEIRDRLPDHLQHWTDIEWQEVSPEILK
jgi:uncharacterized protein YlaN (UPF0358 family)